MAKKSKTFEYCIEHATMDIFYAQCRQLECGLLDVQKEDSITADDGSPAQYYSYRGMEIMVLLDIDLQEIYVTCPFDIAEHIIQP